MARFLVLCAALVLTLSACAEPKTAATPRSIVFPEVDEDNIVEITQKAEEYCLHYGRHAQMVADGWPDGRATFNCVL
jgi:putative hemolysin